MLLAYRRRQENSNRLDSSIPLRDKGTGELQRPEVTSYGAISTANPELDVTKAVVSGREKSGVSTWGAALATSAKSDPNRSVCLLDFTMNGDMPRTFERYRNIIKAEVISELYNTTIQYVSHRSYVLQGYLRIRILEQ